ncbi:type II toxin-antitoxin system VapB family antitoxin (plasmid) [Agrobacterium sp. 13-2099-1-2]|uniref:type II toxin-antitoxin system VapB family antitoxin n=1 Tax=Agrobacterium sp. 13-2099-1-2 TaxID=1841651 RepID=UPI00080FF718|nr:type II toxin-antitoxin system VapB family antitoxin [Agrobacterium sp. 13-2099-1-2]UZX45492.1 type II toxin-antitoxin system VapB family antitoxin [Agrobacterium sp. 13-2099-1-2]
MSLYIRDNAVDELARKVQMATKAPNKTEAVRRALENELARSENAIPLSERVKKLQDEIGSVLGQNPKPFDMKKFTDELWEE